MRTPMSASATAPVPGAMSTHASAQGSAPGSATASAPDSTSPTRATRDVGDLPALRHAIERVDDALLELLSERQRLARQVGAAKRALGVPIADPAREAAVVRRVAERARALALDADATRELFRRVIALAREEQRSS